MDMQSVPKKVMDAATSAIDNFKIDQAVDAAFAAGTVWTVLGAVRKASGLVGPGSYANALRCLGSGLGVVGGVLNLACIGASTYIATEGLLSDSGEIFVDRLIQEGVTEDEIYEVLEKLAITDNLKNAMINRVHETFHGVYVASTVE